MTINSTAAGTVENFHEVRQHAYILYHLKSHMLPECTIVCCAVVNILCSYPPCLLVSCMCSRLKRCTAPRILVYEAISIIALRVRRVQLACEHIFEE